MRDPYKTLGVPREARQDAIKQAYRRLAMELHPDRNPDNPPIAEKFKDVNAAYALVGDVDKRVRFDRGDIDTWGRRRPKPPEPPQAKTSKPASKPQAASKSATDKPTSKEPAASPNKKSHDNNQNQASSPPQKFARTKKRLVSRWLGGSIKTEDLFGPFRPTKTQEIRRELHNLPEPTHKLNVSFLEAARGTTKRLSASRGRTFEVTVPAGIRDGQVIRLKDQGDARPLGGRTDALVKVGVTPHKLFRAKGDDIHLEIPISLEEAVLGARIRVPTVHGSVEVAIPSGANSGAQLRLRGKGLRRPRGATPGDQVIRLVIKLPKTVDPGLKAFVRDRQGQTSFDPRQNLASV
jgi:DnaJ-class molecular chaperone